MLRVTATTASETATDEITVVSTPAVYEVATAAELEAAVDVAQDGAEIVLAANTYTPAKWKLVEGENAPVFENNKEVKLAINIRLPKREYGCSFA